MPNPSPTISKILMKRDINYLFSNLFFKFFIKNQKIFLMNKKLITSHMEILKFDIIAISLELVIY